jgi:transposase
LATDNDAPERTLWGIAIGSKNWLFCGSRSGGKTTAILASVLARCIRHKLDPFAYLRNVLARLPEQPTDRLDYFLPDRCAVT